MRDLLRVEGLSVSFRLRDGDVRVVDNIDLSLARGEVLGIIGESGSGKTVTCSAVLRLLPDNAHVDVNRIIFDGEDVSTLPESEFRSLRGRRIAMIFQDPVGAFNPVKTIGWHFRYVSRRVRDLRPEFAGRRTWWHKAAEVLRHVGIPHAEEILRYYPHQLSGGMLQRCLVGLILQLRPDLIVADEPTTNLDNIVERQIIDLFKRLKAELDASFIFITHDMQVAAQICDRIAVMYAGQVVESAPVRPILNDPKHPYSQGLIRTSRELERRAERLQEIPGELPHWRSMSEGCRFQPRCPYARQDCSKPQLLHHLTDGRVVRCLLYDVALADG